MRLLARPVLLLLVSGLVTAENLPAADIEPAHAKNDIYASLIREGVTLSGTRVTFPTPLLHDGESVASEQAALRKMAKAANRDLKDLLEKTDRADFISNPSDEKAADGSMIRHGNIWFVVYTDLDSFDPTKRPASKDDGKPVSAANMQFMSKLISDAELTTRKVGRTDPKLEWFTHLTADLLDRIHVESTDRSLASHSESSWAYASRTDSRFNDDSQFPNRWWEMDPNTDKVVGKPQVYAGAASTTKISKLVSVPGAILVETHMVFTEPHAWFDGGAVLRSKMTLAAQDQIRRLRRELRTQSKP